MSGTQSTPDHFDPYLYTDGVNANAYDSKAGNQTTASPGHWQAAQGDVSSDPPAKVVAPTPATPASGQSTETAISTGANAIAGALGSAISASSATSVNTANSIFGDFFQSSKGWFAQGFFMLLGVMLIGLGVWAILDGSLRSKIP